MLKQTEEDARSLRQTLKRAGIDLYSSGGHHNEGKKELLSALKEKGELISRVSVLESEKARLEQEAKRLTEDTKEKEAVLLDLNVLNGELKQNLEQARSAAAKFEREARESTSKLVALQTKLEELEKTLKSKEVLLSAMQVIFFFACKVYYGEALISFF